MERTTRKQLEAEVERLNKALGLPTESWVPREDGKGSRALVGNIHLDHNIGGWAVHQMVNEGGGVTCPFGDCRMTAGECWLALRAAQGAVELARATVAGKEAV